MKYVLKKDLPFAKAGAEIEIGFDNNYDELINSKKDKKPAIYLKGQVGLQNLLNDGWVEEIKPKEWYLIKDEHMGVVTGFEKEGLAVAHKNLHHREEHLQIIKVREVENE